jgi:hypothetical protein
MKQIRRLPARGIIAAFFAVTSSFSLAEKPPKQMMRNLEMLSMTHASLSICVNTEERRLLNAAQSLERRKIAVEIEELVQRTGTYYRSAILFPTFLASSTELQSNEGLKKQIRDKYITACSNALLNDASKQVNEAKIQFGSFFGNNGR